ncbi:MAG: glycosyltransferase [Prevotella sp.]|nr:glycosyltransferase [Prevotella sp.]
MIYVRDKGRLCNNILQYGHLYAWGREHQRETMSMRFAYKYRYFKISHTRHHHFLNYLYAKYAAKWGLLPVADFGVDAPNEPEHQEQLLLSHRNIVAEGWYARWYDLFLKYKQEIIGLFAFDQKVRLPVDAMLAGLPVADLRLGVHIRRGDYRTWHQGRYYFSDVQYIGQIRQFLSMQGKKRVQLFICGNDPELDKTVYRQAFPGVEVIFPKGSAGADLYLLSQCDWLMGPPSTFTLVAAMYRDLPLYWIEDAEAHVTADSFGHFDELFRKIK